MIRLWIVAALFAAGALTIVLSISGIFRFRYVLNRMHAAALIDSLALGCILAGLVLMTWNLQFVPKLLVILAVQWISSPIASHLVGQMEVRTDADSRHHMKTEDQTSADSGLARDTHAEPARTAVDFSDKEV